MNAFHNLVKDVLSRYNTPIVKSEDVTGFKITDTHLILQVGEDSTYHYSDLHLEEHLVNYMGTYFYENGDTENNVWERVQGMQLKGGHPDPTGKPGEPGEEGIDPGETFVEGRTNDVSLDNGDAPIGQNDIGWAMDQLKRGLRVSRPSWMGWIVLFETNGFPVIIRAQFDGAAIWVPTANDLFATDYILI